MLAWTGRLVWKKVAVLKLTDAYFGDELKT
jgi:hypothetical protein